MIPPAEEKSVLRRAAEAQREIAARRDPEGAAAAVCEHFLDALDTGAFAVVPFGAAAGYWPIGSEMDPRPILKRLKERDWRIGLPVIIRRGQPLEFREWDPALTPPEGRHHIPAPPEGAPVLRPTLLVVPLLAFDGRCHRLGYGAGYYDRTLAALRRDGTVKAVGLAYAAQRLECLPVTPSDEALDAVVTEEGVVYAI